MGRSAKDDLDTCYKSENANELARIALYYIDLCEAYRELSESQYVMAGQLLRTKAQQRAAGRIPNEVCDRVNAAKRRVDGLERDLQEAGELDA